MELLPEILKVYGPLSLGWLVAVYLLKYILDHMANQARADVEAKIKLATSLEILTKVIDRCAINGGK